VTVAPENVPTKELKSVKEPTNLLMGVACLLLINILMNFFR